jgi:Tol biopolymer transport system component
MKKNYPVYFAAALFLIFQVSCKKKNDAAPNNNNNANPSGTIVFGESVDEVATTDISAGASSVLFHGLDPSLTNDGRILYDLWGQYTADHMEQICISNTNGTGTQTVVDLGQYNSTLYANPKMSKDGKYVSFNFYDGKNYTPVGLKVYTTNGTLVYTANKLWDGSWAPDGSLIAAGTVFALDPYGPQTYGTAGLYKISADFKQTTPIGTGLTNPWYPSVSPDGKKIAFAMNSHIWTINMDGTGLKQITTGPNEETYSCWSPDGTKIATVSDGDIGATSGNGLAIIAADPANTITVSQSESVWVKDKNNTLGLLNPIGNISWK